MPRVMQMSNGKVETFFTPWDFEQLVRQYMGEEAADYLHNLLEELAGYEERYGDEQ